MPVSDTSALLTLAELHTHSPGACPGTFTASALDQLMGVACALLCPGWAVRLVPRRQQPLDCVGPAVAGAGGTKAS